MLSYLKNPLADPIRFELRPQGKKITQRGHQPLLLTRGHSRAPALRNPQSGIPSYQRINSCYARSWRYMYFENFHCCRRNGVVVWTAVAIGHPWPETNCSCMCIWFLYELFKVIFVLKKIIWCTSFIKVSKC